MHWAAQLSTLEMVRAREARIKPVSILIADDHAVVRRGLRALLEAQPAWKVCEEASNGMEAVQKARELKPDLAILDISMPELNGLEAAVRIRKVSPNTRILMLTMHTTEELIEATVQAGARGYMLKSDAERDLIAAVDALIHHKTFFTHTATEILVDNLRRRKRRIGEGAEDDHLTHREREVLQLLAEGRTNKEVAVKLSISHRTVENHRARIMDKLHLHSSSELVRYAIRHKLIEP